MRRRRGSTNLRCSATPTAPRCPGRLARDVADVFLPPPPGAAGPAREASRAVLRRRAPARRTAGLAARQAVGRPILPAWPATTCVRGTTCRCQGRLARGDDLVLLGHGRWRRRGRDVSGRVHGEHLARLEHRLRETRLVRGTQTRRRHVLGSRDWCRTAMTSIHPASSLFTTVEDLARWKTSQRSRPRRAPQLLRGALGRRAPLVRVRPGVRDPPGPLRPSVTVGTDGAYRSDPPLSTRTLSTSRGLCNTDRAAPGRLARDVADVFLPPPPGVADPAREASGRSASPPPRAAAAGRGETGGRTADPASLAGYYLRPGNDVPLRVRPRRRSPPARGRRRAPAGAGRGNQVVPRCQSGTGIGDPPAARLSAPALRRRRRPTTRPRSARPCLGDRSASFWTRTASTAGIVFSIRRGPFRSSRGERDHGRSEKRRFGRLPGYRTVLEGEPEVGTWPDRRRAGCCIGDPALHCNLARVRAPEPTPAPRPFSLPSSPGVLR